MADESSSVATRSALSEPQENLSKVRALLVEDNPVNRKLVLALLTKFDCEVSVAEDGQQAIDLFERDRFDIILMDCQMPGVDGFEATSAIRKMEEQRGGHVPIIALTAHALAEDRYRCLGSGMDDFLTKPFKADDLFKTIERHCSKSEL